jgi:hypothetical protein
MKKIYINTLFFLMLFNFLQGCQSLKDGLEGNKKSKSAEEFLIEKKSPLVLPPDYSKLPTPKNEEEISGSNSSEEFDLNKVLKKKSNSKFKQNKSANSLDKNIIEKIKDN